MRQPAAQTHRHAAIFLPCLVALLSPALRVADYAEKPRVLADGPCPNATGTVWVHLFAHVRPTIFAAPDGVPHVVPAEITVDFLHRQPCAIFQAGEHIRQRVFGTAIRVAPT
jgi:hypothetical protein